MLLHQVDADGTPLSDELRTSLRQHAWQAAAVNLRNKRLLLAALDALSSRGVRPVLLKGYGLGLRLYPDPLLRPSSDVDLLVAPAQLDSAKAALASLGLKPHLESDRYYPPPYRHELGYGGPAGLVELHYRPISAHGVAWEAEGPLSRAAPLEVEGRAGLCLSPEDELVFLSLHAANHLLLRLGWLYDLRLLLQKHPDLDFGRAEEIARKEAKMPALVYYALDAAHRAVDAPVPEHALAALRPTLARQVAARFVFSEARLHDTPLQRSMALRGAAKLLLADSRTQVVLFSVRRLQWNAALKLGLRDD